MLGIAVGVGAWWIRQPHASLRVASVSTTMHPRNEAPQNGGLTSSTVPFTATAPWALSVLPTCVQQIKAVRGSEQYVRASIATDAQPIHAPMVLRYGDCTIEIQNTSALILRGADRLRIPPIAHFFQNTRELFVLHEGGGHIELRVYVPAQPK